MGFFLYAQGVAGLWVGDLSFRHGSQLRQHFLKQEREFSHGITQKGKRYGSVEMKIILLFRPIFYHEFHYLVTPSNVMRHEFLFLFVKSFLPLLGGTRFVYLCNS